MATRISGGLPRSSLPPPEPKPTQFDRVSIMVNPPIDEESITSSLESSHTFEEIKPEKRNKITTFLATIWHKIFPQTLNPLTAEELVQESGLLAQEISDEHVIREDREGLVVLDEKLLNRSALKYKKKNIQELKVYLNNEVRSSELTDVKVGQHLLQPLSRMDRNEPLVHGKVQGTSSKSDNLTNLYITSFDHIRSGVINTPDKIDDLVEAIHLMRPEGPYPIRVMVNQLNSFESRNETNFVNNEHKLLLTIQDVAPQISVVHINTPTSRFYDWNIFFKKTFPQAWVDHFLPGEIRSKQQNLDTLCKLVAWVNEDIDEAHKLDVVDLEAQTDEIEKLVSELQRDHSLDELKILKDRIALKRGEIKTSLKNTYESLDEYLSTKCHDEDKPKVMLLQALLGTQLKIRGKRFSRSQEQLIIKLLNRELDVLSVVNCKSGLDRTGQSSAVELSLVQLLEDGYDKNDIIKMALEWDRVSRESTLGKTDPEHLLVQALRNRTLKNLISTGLVLTYNSTGMVGLKWGKGLRGQLVPLNYLPPKIYIDDTKVTLVSYHLNGTPKGLTTTGHRLLTRLSNLRGT